MCEYEPDCTGSDDAAAVRLWLSKSKPLLSVECPHRERLAEVHRLADGTLVLCTPHKPLHATYVQDDGATHLHAALTPLEQVTWIEYGRCRHGLWGWEPELLTSALNMGLRTVEPRPTVSGELGSWTRGPG